MNRHSDAVDLLESALNTLPDGKSDRDLIQKFKTAQRLLKKAQRPDLYKLIGQDLDEHSHESAIKKAYKKAAMKWHPDRFSCKGVQQQKEAEEQFQKINDAYEFLTDAQRKRLWDQGFDREEIEQQLEMHQTAQSLLSVWSIQTAGTLADVPVRFAPLQVFVAHPVSYTHLTLPTKA